MSLDDSELTCTPTKDEGESIKILNLNRTESVVVADNGEADVTMNENPLKDCKEDLSAKIESCIQEHLQSSVSKAEVEALKSQVTELVLTKVTDRVAELMSKAVKEIEMLQHEMHTMKRDIERNNRMLAKMSRENLNNDNITSTHEQRLPTPVVMPTSALPLPPETSELALSDCREYQQNDNDWTEDLRMDLDQHRILKRKTRDCRVEITEDDGSSRKKQKPTLTRNSTRKKHASNTHFQFLKECFHRDVGLPLDQPQARKICSFNNTLIAKGYQRVVCTQQGIYYELKEEDIIFDNLKEKLVTDEKERRWFTKGVTVYQWDSDYRHILSPHRFAVIPEGTEGDWRQIKPGNSWQEAIHA